MPAVSIDQPAVQVHYSGVLVTPRPGRHGACAAALDRLEGVSVRGLYPEQGRIVAVVEGSSADHLAERLVDIRGLPDVALVVPAVHYVDDGPGAVDPASQDP